MLIQSELDNFKANIPPTETVLAEWFLKKLWKGRLIHSHHVGNTYLLMCTDTSLYMLKLAQKKIHSYKKYSLLEFTNIQVYNLIDFLFVANISFFKYIFFLILKKI